MRLPGLLLLGVLGAVVTASAQASVQGGAQAAVGTMSELMVQVIYPTSDAIFYITTRTPKTEAEWVELQGKTLMLAESDVG